MKAKTKRTLRIKLAAKAKNEGKGMKIENMNNTSI